MFMNVSAAILIRILRVKQSIKKRERRLSAGSVYKQKKITNAILSSLGETEFSFHCLLFMIEICCTVYSNPIFLGLYLSLVQRQNIKNVRKSNN